MLKQLAKTYKHPNLRISLAWRLSTYRSVAQVGCHLGLPWRYLPVALELRLLVRIATRQEGPGDASQLGMEAGLGYLESFGTRNCPQSRQPQQLGCRLDTVAGSAGSSIFMPALPKGVVAVDSQGQPQPECQGDVFLAQSARLRRPPLGTIYWHLDRSSVAPFF